MLKMQMLSRLPLRFISQEGENYGNSFEFTVIALWKSRTYFAEDRNEPPICMSLDGFTSINGHKCKNDCPHNTCAWIDSNPPPCANQYNFLILPIHENIPEGFPGIVTFMRTSYKAGQKLYTLLISARCSMWFWQRVQ